MKKAVLALKLQLPSAKRISKINKLEPETGVKQNLSKHFKIPTT